MYANVLEGEMPYSHSVKEFLSLIRCQAAKQKGTRRSSFVVSVIITIVISDPIWLYVFVLMGPAPKHFHYYAFHSLSHSLTLSFGALFLNVFSMSLATHTLH